MRSPSLRKFLLLAILSFTVLMWGVTSWLSYLNAEREISEVFDSQLVESAKVLLAQASHEIRERGGEVDEDFPSDHFGSRYVQRLYFQVRDRQGRLLMGSGAAVPREPLSLLDAGFENTQIQGQGYRVFSLWNRQHEIKIQVAQRLKERQGFSAGIARRVAAPLAFALPLLALLIVWSIHRGLSPLRSAARELGLRHPDNLSPVAREGVPVEILPLTDAVNGLLARLRSALEKERRFTSDAAHELRTPLAALRAQAEVARGAKESSVRDEALRGLIEAVDRSTHLISQLLDLARLDPQAAFGNREKFHLEKTVRGVLAVIAPRALGRNVEIEFHCGEISEFTGYPLMMDSLVRNLVENALRHSPAGGKVRVALTVDGGAHMLEVSDSGPGIPVAEHERVFERFYRGSTSQGVGSGLGLSIVQRIAEIHGARIELSEPPGLSVRVKFPVAGSKEL